MTVTRQCFFRGDALQRKLENTVRSRHPRNLQLQFDSHIHDWLNVFKPLWRIYFKLATVKLWVIGQAIFWILFILHFFLFAYWLLLIIAPPALISLTLSCHLSLIDHRFWQVFKATSCIGTELLYVGSSWSSYLCSSMWRDPQEYIIYKFVLISPAVPRMSGSSNLDSFRDGC